MLLGEQLVIYFLMCERVEHRFGTLSAWMYASSARKGNSKELL